MKGKERWLKNYSSLLMIVMSPGTLRALSSATGRCGSRVSERAAEAV